MPYKNKTGLPSVTQIISPYVDKRYFKPEHAERGTRVHAACSAYLSGAWVAPLAPGHQPYFDSFRRWADKYVDGVLLVEKRLTSTHGFCGQPDAVLTLKGSDSVVLVDWKTSQAYYRTFGLQLAAYRQLIVDNEPFVPERCLTVRTKKDGSGCLINELTGVNHKYAVFLGLLNAHRYFNGDG